MILMFYFLEEFCFYCHQRALSAVFIVNMRKRLICHVMQVAMVTDTTIMLAASGRPKGHFSCAPFIF